MKMIFILSILAIVSLYLSAWSFTRRNQVPGAMEFSLFLLTVALYDFGYAIELNCNTLEEIYWALRIQYLGLPFMTVLYFLFSVCFVLEKDFPRSVKVLLFLIPFVTVLLVFSLGSHSLFYREASIVTSSGVSVLSYKPGIWYLIHFSYLIALSIAGEVILLIGFLRFKGIKKKQVFLIFLSGLLPLITGIFTPGRFYHFDIQPFSLATMGIFLSIAILKHRLLELIPHARELAFDSINEYLIVLDHSGRIRDMNVSAKASELFQNMKNDDHLIERAPFCDFLQNLLDTIEQTETAQKFRFCFMNHHFYMKVYGVKAPQLDNLGFSLIIRETTETVKLMNELKEQAIYDELTGLYNRRQIFSLAEREVLLSRRSGSNTGIILLDLDRFKTVNDTYGHLAGDEVLSSVSQALQEAMRATDLIGRYGGEEFIVICPCTDSDTSRQIAERLRRSIESLDIVYEGIKISVSASFGVKSGIFLNDMSLSDFLESADRALYTAKEEGRNRVVLAD